MHDIRQSGLLAAIRSGYDVRLIVDMVRTDNNAQLPSDRIKLYEAVLEAGWPASSAEKRTTGSHRRRVAHGFGA